MIVLNVALQPLDDSDGRGLPRYRLLTAATGRGAGDSDFPVTLHNLSATGLLIETETALRIGSSILVAVPNAGELAATVVWTGGGYHGAQFAKPLSQAAVRACLAESKVVWPSFTERDDLAPPRIERAPNPQAALIAAAEAVYAESVEVEENDWSPARRVQILLVVSALLWFGIVGAISALLA